MSNTQITAGLARAVSRSLPDCALLHLPRGTFDLDLARQQHAGYVSALEQAGVRMTVLPELADLPDATFVEDTVVVLDEVAVVCRLGAASREREADVMVPAVAPLRPVRRIISPGTLEGGDVLRLGRTLFVGLSSRSNTEGIRQLEAIVGPSGYQVRPVTVRGCLHLKTAVTAPADGLLVANSAWVDLTPFAELEIVPVPADEPWGANTLAVNGTVLVAGSAPETARCLSSRGLSVRCLDVSELQKAEAGLTCLSVLFPGARLS